MVAYLLLSPALLIIGCFGLFPIGYSIYISFFEWHLKQGPFVGLSNYLEIFGSWDTIVYLFFLVIAIVIMARITKTNRSTVSRIITRTGSGLLIIGFFLLLSRIWTSGDADMLRSLQITFWFALGTIPVQMVCGLLIALSLDAKFHGRQLFRVVFLLPYIVPVVASSGVFALLFSLSPDSMANQILHFFGAKPSQWLRESTGIIPLLRGVPTVMPSDGLSAWLASWTSGPSLALICMMIFNNWLFSGYYALIFSNGLAAIPRSLYEAATIDGARKSTIFFRIVAPLLSPTTAFLALFGIIGTFKAFNSLYVLRDAATGGATDPTSVYIFFTFFREQRYGYAAALALIFFVCVLVITLITRKTIEKRVFYE